MPTLSETQIATPAAPSRWGSITQPTAPGWLLGGLLLVCPAILPALPILGAVAPSLIEPSVEPASQPQVRFRLEPSTPSPGEPFDLIVEARWDDAGRPVALTPPHLDLPAEFERLAVRTATSDAGDGAQATWRLTLSTEQPGTYRLAPMALAWTTAKGPESTLLATPEVTIGSPVNPVSALTLATGLGGLGVLLWLAWGRWHRVRQASNLPSAVDEDRRQRLEAAWREARRRRLAGDRAAAVERLVELERELGGLGIDAPTLGGQPLEEIRYGGRLPTGPELDQLERRVEMALRALRPESEERRRAPALGEQPTGELWRRPS